MRRGRARLLLGTVLLGTGLSLGMALPAAADQGCPTQRLEVSGPLVSGAQLVVSGTGFVGCQDTGRTTDGGRCSGPQPVREPTGPILGLQVVLTQAGVPYVLGTANAGSDGRFALTFTVPPTLDSGRARISAADTSAEFTVSG